jgi:hypothetical protein
MARPGSYPQGTINSCAKRCITSSYKPLTSTFLVSVSTPQVKKLMSLLKLPLITQVYPSDMLCEIILARERAFASFIITNMYLFMAWTVTSDMSFHSTLVPLSFASWPKAADRTAEVLAFGTFGQGVRGRG